jgi:cytoskeletal protein CcmA (bactofilin family)
LPVEQSVLGKGLKFKGTISGSDSLYVDGTVEGSINIPGQRVTIGMNGHVLGNMATTMNPCITAREIVVMGEVTGNVVASDRVEIRAEGMVLGDVSSARISIADGAYFRGEVDLRKPDAKDEAVDEPVPAPRGVSQEIVKKDEPPKPVDAELIKALEVPVPDPVKVGIAPEPDAEAQPELNAVVAGDPET